MAFNTFNFGMTRLDAVLLATANFRLGISDYRGDGRPDFRYRARVFYGDRVIPPARQCRRWNSPRHSRPGLAREHGRKNRSHECAAFGGVRESSYCDCACHGGWVAERHAQ